MVLRQIGRFKAIAQFVGGRVGPYGELLKLELALYRQSLIATILGYVGLVLCALFAATFISVAILVTYWDSTSRTAVAWYLAGGWQFAGAYVALAVLLGLVSYLVGRMTSPKGEPFNELLEEVRLDVDAIRSSDEQNQNRITKK